jgi:S-(hydroxymethyl)glutathione dehydrogenase/alcohol dehydrogenase
MVRAAVLREVGKSLSIEEVILDDPAPHEVLIRTAAVGVCRSDLHFIEGHYSTEMPVVPGHEAAGVVEAVGSDVRYVGPGDHVITCMSVFCGHCKLCTTGRPYLCQDPEAGRADDEPPRISRDGEQIHQLYHLSSYAEKMLVHERAVVKIRRDMPLDRAALIGCAVLTGFGAVTNTANVEIGSSVAIIGCGGVGLAAILGAVAAGAQMIVAVDIVPEKLELARAFGATHVIDATDVDPVEAVIDLTDGGVEFSFEALGRKETAEQAFQMLRAGGVATVIGMVPEHQMIEVDASELLNEKALHGSNMGSNHFRVDMPNLVDRYMSGSLPLDDMISKRVSLDQINEAFEDMKSGSVARTVIVFE